MSKSVDSLLAVASSISLPAQAVLRAKNPNSETLVESSVSGNGGVSPSGHAVRRHSYDVNALQRETSDEFYDCSEGQRQEVVSDGDVTASSSSEASPRHLPRSSIGRSSYDSHYGRPSGIPSPCVRRLSDIIGRARVANSSLGGTASRGGSSSRDSLESDMDERGDVDSQIFSSNSCDANTSLPGSPVIKVERHFEQVGRLFNAWSSKSKPQGGKMLTYADRWFNQVPLILCPVRLIVFSLSLNDRIIPPQLMRCEKGRWFIISIILNL